MTKENNVENGKLIQFPIYKPHFSGSKTDSKSLAPVYPIYRLERMTLEDVSRSLVGLTNFGPIVLGVRNYSNRERDFESTYSIQIFKVGEHSPAVSHIQPYCVGDLDKIATEIKPDVMRFKRKSIELPLSFTIKRLPEDSVWQAYLTFRQI